MTTTQLTEESANHLPTKETKEAAGVHVNVEENALVTIPAALIKRLENLGPRFVLLTTHTKKAFQEKWQDNLKEANDAELQTHLAKGGNYGVAGGAGLIWIDADTPEVTAKIDAELPPTLSVQSPGSMGHHYAFLCHGYEGVKQLRDKESKSNVGHIKGDRSYVVGPNSIHPNGGRYVIIRDVQIASINAEKLFEVLEPWIIKKEKEVEAEAIREKQLFPKNGELRIESVVDIASLTPKGGDQYQGSHPVHGSSTRNNFSVNTAKNCWYCFRCDTGGGPVLWLAVREGVIDCSEALPGALSGKNKEKGLQTFKRAEELGLLANLPDRKKKNELSWAETAASRYAPVPPPQPYGTELELYELILNTFKRHVLLEKEEHYHILTAWVMATWRIEDTNYAPILYITAPKGHAKTWLCVMLRQMVHLPILASLATKAAILRAVNGSNATLILDEAESYINPEDKFGGDQEMMTCLNAGVQPGSPALLCDENNQPMLLDSFGYKVIASRKEIFETLLDRSVQIITPKSVKRYERLTKQEGEEIRAKLNQYRTDCLSKKQPLTYPIVTQDPRLADVLEPLIAITPPEHRSILETIVKEEETLRRERREETIEYKVLAAFSDAVDKLQPSDKSVSTEEVRAELSDQNISSVTVGRTLSRLGFEKIQVPTLDPKTNKRTTRRHWKVNRTILNRLKSNYELQPTSDESHESDTGSPTMDTYTAAPAEATSATVSDTSDTSDTKPTV
jgi:hypothetical protein